MVLAIQPCALSIRHCPRRGCRPQPNRWYRHHVELQLSPHRQRWPAPTMSNTVGCHTWITRCRTTCGTVAPSGSVTYATANPTQSLIGVIYRWGPKDRSQRKNQRHWRNQRRGLHTQAPVPDGITATDAAVPGSDQRETNPLVLAGYPNGTPRSKGDHGPPRQSGRCGLDDPHGHDLRADPPLLVTVVERKPRWCAWRIAPVKQAS